MIEASVSAEGVFNLKFVVFKEILDDPAPAVLLTDQRRDPFFRWALVLLHMGDRRKPNRTAAIAIRPPMRCSLRIDTFPTLRLAFFSFRRYWLGLRGPLDWLLPSIDRETHPACQENCPTPVMANNLRMVSCWWRSWTGFQRSGCFAHFAVTVSRERLCLQLTPL